MVEKQEDSRQIVANPVISLILFSMA